MPYDWAAIPRGPALDDLIFMAQIAIPIAVLLVVFQARMARPSAAPTRRADGTTARVAT